MSVRARLLLGLAILREVHNKVLYYEGVVERRRERLSALKDRALEGRALERELRILEEARTQLHRVGLFLEGVISRLETALTSESLILALKLLEGAVRELREAPVRGIPILSIYVDELQAVTRELLRSAQGFSGPEVTAASREAERIVSEIKAAAFSSEPTGH